MFTGSIGSKEGAGTGAGTTRGEGATTERDGSPGRKNTAIRRGVSADTAGGGDGAIAATAGFAAATIVRKSALPVMDFVSNLLTSLLP